MQGRTDPETPVLTLCSASDGVSRGHLGRIGLRLLLRMYLRLRATKRKSEYSDEEGSLTSLGKFKSAGITTRKALSEK